jgi:WD40 repeat protein
MSDAFDPYHKWLAIPPRDQPPHHYRLLGLELYEPDVQVIESAADRQMAHVRTFQSGQNGGASQKLLNELAAAKLCLLQPEKKAAYDAALRKRLAPPRPAALPRAAPLAAASPPPAVAGMTTNLQPPLSAPAIASISQTARRRASHPLLLAAGGGAVALMTVALGVVLWSALSDSDGSSQVVSADASQVPPTDPPAPAVDASSATNGAAPAEPEPAEPDAAPPEEDPLDVELPPPDGEPDPLAEEEPAEPAPTYDPAIAVAGMTPGPCPYDPCPEELREALKFDWPAIPAEDVANGALEFDVLRDSAVYLVVTWLPETDLDGAWAKERLTRAQLVELGWEDLGACPWATMSETLFRRLCRAGESHRVRVNRLWPPAVLARNVTSEEADRLAMPPSTPPAPTEELVAEGELVGHSGEVLAVAFASGGRQAVTAGGGVELLVWDVAERRLLFTLDAQTARVNSLAADGKGIIVVAGTGNPNVPGDLCGVATFSLRTRRPLEQFASPEGGITRGAAISADGQRLISVHPQGAIHLWDARNGRLIRTFTGVAQDMQSVAFHPDGKQFATVGNDALVRIWSVDSEREKRSFGPFGDGLACVQYSPDGTRLLCCGNDLMVHVLDPATGSELATMVGHEMRVNAARFAHDGRRVLSCSSDGTLRWWDAETGGELAQAAGHSGIVFSCAVSPDAKTAISTGQAGEAKVWKLPAPPAE